MREKLGIISICALLAGCGTLGESLTTSPDDAVLSDGQTRPQARPGELDTTVQAPPVNARTVEEFDTTTAEQRAAAASGDVSGEAALGSTIVSLGDPTRPGFWIETPLVNSAGSGRVVYAATGKSAQVDLIPAEGPSTAGSRMSLSAMRLIDAPLTGLVEVQVFSGG